MAATDIYRHWDEVGISARGDCTGATNILRAKADLPGDASPKVKSEQKTLETPTVPWPIGSGDLPENRALDKTIVYGREKVPAAPCADTHHAPWHEYEWPERRPEVRKVGIRIPGHIRPPLASPSNSFGTLQPPRHATVYLHSRDALSVVT